MTRILALETSGLTGSVAVRDHTGVLAERTLDDDQRSARWLAPAIQRTLTEVGWKPHDLDLVAVTTGPGSFTGLRVGVTTAKVLAYAASAEVLGVNTLEAIAMGMPRRYERFTVVLDAQRQQSYLAEFHRDEHGQLTVVRSTEIVDNQAWIAGLHAEDVVTGLGLTKLCGQLPAGIVIAEENFWTPRAAAVGQIAETAFAAGKRDDPFTLVPNYFRRTAAEEQWELKRGHGA